MRMLIPLLVLVAFVGYLEACGKIVIGGKGNGNGNQSPECPAEGECPCDTLPLEDDFAEYVLIDGAPAGGSEADEGTDEEDVNARKKRSGEQSETYDHNTEAVIDVAGLLEYYGLTEGDVVCVVETSDGDQDLEFTVESPPEVTVVCTDGYWDGAVEIDGETISLDDVTKIECGILSEEEEGEDESAGDEEEEESADSEEGEEGDSEASEDGDSEAAEDADSEEADDEADDVADDNDDDGVFA